MSRFPFIKQKDSMQCGVACLAMMAALHGRRYSLAALGRYCHATTEGVSMLGISQGAQAIGMETAAARVTSDQLARLGKPCIVHWNQNHFVVLHKVSRRGRFLVADPGKGMVKYSRSEFESHWLSTVSGGEDKGIALFMEPKPEFFIRHEDATSEKRSFRFLAGYIRQYRKYFTQILLGLMLGCVLQLILPFLTQSIVDIGIRHSDVGFIWLVLLGELMIVTGRTATDFILRWWRRHCGVVMQDGVIFSESIARNIAVSDSDIDVERLENAARIACIHDYVTSLPLGYNTAIGPDGAGLSQGQKQRILIARAVYRDPDFIFLDEATNSLDAKNERAIVENLAEFYRGKTVVVVAHRLSTVRNADSIIVIDGGKVAETGTHESLIEKKGSYYNLVRNQLELGN